MKVTGKNLQNGCKLVFALSREDTNDSLFMEEKISGAEAFTRESCTLYSLSHFEHTLQYQRASLCPSPTSSSP